MTGPPALPSGLLDLTGGGNGLLGRLLAALPDDVREAMMSQARIVDVKTGTIVVEAKRQTDKVGYVLDGTLGMVQIIDENRRHIVGLLVPTDIFGGMFKGPSNYQIEALSPAKIVCFPSAHFEEVLLKNPEAERLYLMHLLDEMDAAREWLMLISGQKVINRVASFLTILARRRQQEKQTQPLRLHLPLARKDLAQYLGARPESLSRAFHELQDKGLLRLITPYVFDILDLDGLFDISGDDLALDDCHVPGSHR